MKRLVSVLSTGRTGTKYLTEYFRRQRLLAFHERFHGVSNFNYRIIAKKYSGKNVNIPLGQSAYFSDVINEYLDNFTYLTNKNKYFANYYCGQQNAPLLKRLDHINSSFRRPIICSNDHVIDCNNGISLLFEDIFQACKQRSIDTFPLILFRNPIKTIHAIYVIESRSSFNMRPKTFQENHKGPCAAASIWKNTYEFFLERLQNNVLKLDIERFGEDTLEPLFKFLDIKGIKLSLAKELKREVENKPLRSAKRNDIKNSDLYLDRKFRLSHSEISSILPIIKKTCIKLNLDLDKSVHHYNEFHQEIKPKLRFK